MIRSLFTALLLALPTTALAQEDPIHWALEPVAAVAAGESGEIEVRAVLDSAWHVYGLTQPRPPIALRFEFEGDDALTMGAPRQPRPIRRFDEAFGIETEFFEGAVPFRVPFSIAAGTPTGTRRPGLRVHYQVCTDQVCLPPASELLTFRLTVNAAAPAGTTGAAAPAPAAPAAADETMSAPEPDSSASVDSLLEGAAAQEDSAAILAAAGADDGARDDGARPQQGGGGLGSYVMLAALMGLFALTTPCVFPMVPITVSYFTRRQPEAAAAPAHSRRSQIRDAGIYGGGIIVAFTGLGLLLALIYGATGINRFAANPFVNLLVAGLFIAFALDLLGAWEMRLPWQLVSRVNAESQRRGIAGLLFMGVAFAVTTFTCTVPFVGTLLVSAASGEWTRPIVGMLAFSTMFALPFFVLALFPSLLRSLPKSGGWMGSFKVMLGLVELGAALKFMSNADLVWQLGLLQRSVVIAAWIALAMLGALHLLGLLRLPFEAVDRTDNRIGIGRMLGGGAFAAIALFLLPGLFERPVGAFDAFLPPRDYSGGATASASFNTKEPVWLADYEHAQAEAVATGRNIFVDFTGYTCTNCRWMEANVFTEHAIRSRLDQYVLVRLYTDGRGERYVFNQRLQLERFGTVALPFYAILGPDGATIETFPGLTRKSAEFAAFLDVGLRTPAPARASGI
jgi:thiol:disulfide interchange protein